MKKVKGIIAYNISVPKYKKLHGAWFPEGHKSFWILRSGLVDELPSTKDKLHESDLTSDNVRKFFHGETEFTTLMAQEHGSDGSIQGDLAAYSRYREKMEAMLNNPPEIPRQVNYSNSHNWKIAQLQGNTLSRAILAWRKNNDKTNARKD